VLEDVDEDGFDGDAAVFVALAADLKDGAVVGAAEVADVGAQHLVGAQTGQQGTVKLIGGLGDAGLSFACCA
jgi:hypothetical protein